MDSFTYIDEYFKSPAIAEKQTDFEKRLLSDKEFAEEVAFYLSLTQVMRTQNIEEKKKRFRKIYYDNDLLKSASPVKKLWQYTAVMAAVLSALVFGLYLMWQTDNPNKLAVAYLKHNLPTLGVQMSNTKDLLQSGISLYNDSKYTEALQIFEELVQNDTANYIAKENAGIAAVQGNKYDKAILYFQQVAKNDGLADNPGKFYEALTLMKRNGPGDKERAKILLNEVIEGKLYGENEAVIFLKKM